MSKSITVKKAGEAEDGLKPDDAREESDSDGQPGYSGESETQGERQGRKDIEAAKNPKSPSENPNPASAASGEESDVRTEWLNQGGKV